MIKLIFALRRLPHLSREQFQDHWRTRHAPLVREAQASLGIRRYVQSHSLSETANAPLRTARGTAPEYDGIAELWFDNIAALMPATSEGRDWARRLFQDEKTFIDLARSPIWMSEEVVVCE